MTPQEKKLWDLSNDATLKTGELTTLLRLIQEMEIDLESNDDCPEYINANSMGAMRSASILMAELANGLVEDLATEIGRIRGSKK